MGAKCKVSGVLFCLFYHDYRELEWVMPLLHHYRQRKIHITVLMPIKPRTERQHLMMGWLVDYYDELLYPCDMVYGVRNCISTLCSRSEHPTTAIDLLIKALFYPGNRVALRTGLAHLHRRLAMRNMHKLLATMDIVYVPEHTMSEKIHPQSIAGLIVAAARIAGKPLVGYLITIHKESRLRVDMGRGLDLLMIQSEEDERGCERIALPAVLSGAQRFRADWIQELKRVFAQTESAQVLNQAIGGQPVALVLLKNNTGCLSREYTENIRREVRHRLFISLIERGYFLLVKPHPGEPQHRLTDDLSHIPKGRYFVSELPASYLACISCCAVLELPSNSVMDAIAAGIQTFWPIRLFKASWSNFNQDQLAEYLASNGCHARFVKLVELGLPHDIEVKPVNKCIREYFQHLANTHIKLDPMIRNCERQLSLRADGCE